jgi:hypothetical protein
VRHRRCARSFADPRVRARRGLRCPSPVVRHRVLRARHRELRGRQHLALRRRGCRPRAGAGLRRLVRREGGRLRRMRDLRPVLQERRRRSARCRPRHRPPGYRGGRDGSLVLDKDVAGVPLEFLLDQECGEDQVCEAGACQDKECEPGARDCFDIFTARECLPPPDSAEILKHYAMDPLLVRAGERRSTSRPCPGSPHHSAPTAHAEIERADTAAEAKAEREAGARLRRR